jgi:SEC-C motif domain protein
MSCYCGSGLEFSNCCEPFILGTKKPDSPEALMRSRYSAYVTANTAYLKKTLVPKERSLFKESDVLEWAKSEWLGLEVIEAKGNIVEFTAKYKMKGKLHEHHEVSKFKKIDDQWYFESGDSHVHEGGHGHHHHHEPIAPIVREAPKVHRNDPCICGSGKKFKKCCGS